MSGWTRAKPWAQGFQYHHSAGQTIQTHNKENMPWALFMITHTRKHTPSALRPCASQLMMMYTVLTALARLKKIKPNHLRVLCFTLIRLKRTPRTDQHSDEIRRVAPSAAFSPGRARTRAAVSSVHLRRVQLGERTVICNVLGENGSWFKGGGEA